MPPSGACIYKPPTLSKTLQDTQAIATLRGIQLWKNCLNDVIELTHKHRQADPKWATSFERWRINQPTAEDIEDTLGISRPESAYYVLHPPPRCPKNLRYSEKKKSYKNDTHYR